MKLNKVLLSVSTSAKLSRPEFIPKFVRNANYVENLKPQDYTIDCSRFQNDLCDPKLRVQVTDLFNQVGLVHLVNTGTNNAQRLKEPFSHILGLGTRYDGGANPRQYIEDNVLDTGAKFDHTIHYHHEMQYMHQSIRSIAFMCLDMSARVDGSTFFSNNLGYSQDLMSREIGKKILKKGVCITRRWTDENFFKDKPLQNYCNHWQLSFNTHNRKAVEELANKSCMVECSWDSEGQFSGKYYPEIFEYCPFIDRNLLFFHIADHALWFDTCPFTKGVPDSERPITMTYADGSEFRRDEILECLEVADNHGLKIDWQTGDSLLACNYRFMHGRPQIQLGAEQERKIGVVLGERFSRIGPLPGKY